MRGSRPTPGPPQDRLLSGDVLETVLDDDRRRIMLRHRQAPSDDVPRRTHTLLTMKPPGHYRLAELLEVQSHGSQARRRLLLRGPGPRTRGCRLLADRLRLPTRPMHPNALPC